MIKLGAIIYAIMLCHGAFEYRSGNPDLLFPVQSAIHDYSTPVVMMTPALLPFADGLLVNSSMSRPYSEQDLTTGSSVVQYGRGDYGLQLSWNMFGADFYREHTFSVKAGYSLFSFLSAGISENCYILNIETDELTQDRKAYDTDFALIFTPCKWVNAALIQNGITSLFNEQNRDMIYPERSAGIMLNPGKGFSLTWNITDTAAERVNLFTATVNPVSFLTVKGGYCRENSSFSASIGIMAKSFLVSYGLKYHPYLGYTHSIGITYTAEPRIESLDYGKPLLSSPVKKINIMNASPDEIKSISGISPQSAERIISYRNKIGPINEKALMQIGMTGEEITHFEACVYGLERTHHNKEDKKEFRKFVKRPQRKERIKNRFRELIQEGIPAYTAITYSELSESDQPDEFSNRLNNDSTISAEQKNIIERTCSK